MAGHEGQGLCCQYLGQAAEPAGEPHIPGHRGQAHCSQSERGWQREALERQLDHKEANAAVAAYARSQHLDERRRFMADWDQLVEELESGTNVVSLPSRAA